MKKRGFGAGLYNGVGGKPKLGETMEEAAVRECQEEIGVTPLRYEKRGVLSFYFPPERKGWDQEVTIFICTEWKGEPSESEEMRPAWFDFHSMPYHQMWRDDPIWMPRILSNQFVHAEFHFDDQNNVATYTIDSPTH